MWRYEPNTLLNADCLPVMREMPDKFFQLAIVDPPYGIGNDGQKKKVCSNPKQSRKEHEKKDWDSKGIPGAEYFRELGKFHVVVQREEGGRQEIQVGDREVETEVVRGRERRRI